MALAGGQRRTPVDVRDAVGFQAAFGVSRETVERLTAFVETLRTWQKTLNLVSAGSLDVIWQRHVADSAQILALAPSGSMKWVDLGSGGGFPGLVLAILLAEKGLARVILVESDARKCAFLREVARKTGLSGSMSVDIVTGRIENPQIQSRVGTADVVTARALAPLEQLFGLARPLFHQETVGLFPKGRDAEREVDLARVAWEFEAELVDSVTDGAARVVVVRNLRALGVDRL